MIVKLPSQKERCVNERREESEELEYEHLHREAPFNGSLRLLILYEQKQQFPDMLHIINKHPLQCNK